MSSLVELVGAYRESPRLAERMRLAEEVVHCVGPALRDYVVRRVRSEFVQDTFQETLVTIAAQLHHSTATTDSQFWAWCYRIARNKCADAGRRQPAEEFWDPQALWQVIEASAVVEPLAAGERLDLEHALNLLSQAKPPCRHLLWWRYVLGWDYAEIAEATGSAYDAVRMQIRRCLELAQELVAQHL